MRSGDDQATSGFSVSGDGGARQWSAADMQRAVPLPTPTLPVPVGEELAAQVIGAAMGRLASSGTVSIDQIADDLGETSEKISSCIRGLAQR